MPPQIVDPFRSAFQACLNLLFPVLAARSSGYKYTLSLSLSLDIYIYTYIYITISYNNDNNDNHDNHDNDNNNDSNNSNARGDQVLPELGSDVQRGQHRAEVLRPGAGGDGHPLLRPWPGGVRAMETMLAETMSADVNQALAPT